MENEENTDELPVEITTEETEVVEETETETQEETPEAKRAKAQAEAAKYRRLLEKEQSKPKGTPQAFANVEETVLLANGMPEELMEELKAVAAVRKVSLLKAQADPIFVAVKEKFEKDLKQASASLPASRGSGVVKAQKTFNTPGLSREEHMALAKAH
jgi:phage terminase large subunit